MKVKVSRGKGHVWFSGVKRGRPKDGPCPKCGKPNHGKYRWCEKCVAIEKRKDFLPSAADMVDWGH